MLELHHKQKLVCCRFPQDARDDVGGAQTAGMLGILVRTGKNKLFIISSSATCHGICVCVYIYLERDIDRCIYRWNPRIVITVVLSPLR